MRKSLAALCLVLAASTACAASGTPTPSRSPSGGSTARMPGYVLTGSQSMHSVNCHTVGHMSYLF